MVRACGRASFGSGSCSSVRYPSHDVKYTEICGKVRGYQYYSIYQCYIYSQRGINSYYIDGMSLTRGRKTIHTDKVVLVKLTVNGQTIFLLLLEVTITVNLATHLYHPVMLPSSILLIHYGMVNSAMGLSLLVAAPQCFLGFTNY